MTRLYSDADLWDAVIQRRKILGVFFAVTAVLLAAFIASVVIYVGLPYGSPDGPWVIASVCIVVGLYLIFVFPFMGIKFKRSNAYCKMLKFISRGLKEAAFLAFEDIDDWVTHDGVDVNVAVFTVYSIKKDEPLRRQIFVDGEKSFPAFEVGKKVKFVAQGNLLIEYELTDET